MLLVSLFVSCFKTDFIKQSLLNNKNLELKKIRTWLELKVHVQNSPVFFKYFLYQLI